MPHTTEHHVEEVEHALHGHEHGHGHAPDNFNARVAMSMAIIAALLAGVTMLSHRAHNQTLSLQAEANRIETEAARLQTEANIHHTQATDQWSFYQAKNIRDHQYQAYTRLLAVLPREPSAEAARAELLADWKKQTDKYASELPKMKADAEALVKKAEELQAAGTRTLESARKTLDESHHAHHRGDRFDLAELAVEMGLILCSIAVLTKKLPFWIGGIAFGVLGVGVAASAFLMH